jgi:hypothetical protein
VTGAWVDNLGALSSPRAAAGLAIRSGGRRFELAARVGLEGLWFRDTTAVMLGGEDVDVARSIVSIGAHVAMRARVPVSPRAGLAIGAAVVPMRARVRLAPDGDRARTYGENVIAARGEIAGDVIVGRGRLVLSMSYGRAPLTDGAVTGHIDGLAITAGYERWLSEVPW